MNLINQTVGLSGALIITLLLSACQHPQQKQPDDIANLCQPHTAPGSTACQWTGDMQRQLNHRFKDAAHYAGQQCLVRLEWKNSGRYAVTQTQGDEALCLRAWQLIGQSVDLPPPPVRNQPAWFGFAPQRASLPAPPGATGAG